jgi:penicillin-binding protein 1A
VYLQDGQSVPLELAAVTWAHAYQDESHRGPAVKRVDALLKPGDVVRMARGPDGKWKLSQVPAAQGALIALNPEARSPTSAGSSSISRGSSPSATGSNIPT